MRALHLVYKTRWIMVLFLFYIAGLWLEGPPTRIFVLTDIFMLTFILLSMYSSIYLFLKFPKYQKVAVFINTCITVFFLWFVRVRYNGAILEGTDIVFYISLFMVFLQVIILGRKVLDEK
jgi:hypothetical protein